MAICQYLRSKSGWSHQRNCGVDPSASVRMRSSWQFCLLFLEYRATAYEVGCGYQPRAQSKRKLK